VQIAIGIAVNATAQLAEQLAKNRNIGKIGNADERRFAWRQNHRRHYWQGGIF
jgi:hypothetical protein